MSIGGQIIPGSTKLLQQIVVLVTAGSAAPGLDAVLRTHGRNARLTCRHFGISPDMFYRWWRRRGRWLPRPYAQRLPHGYRVVAPGDLVQVDTLDIAVLPDLRRKQFTARDMVSRYDVVEVYGRATAHTATTFSHSAPRAHALCGPGPADRWRERIPRDL